MCTVIGYRGAYNSELLNKVFFNSRIRGLHAFGYSYYEGNDIVTKKFVEYDKFVKSINADKPDLFIAHFRYSTSGNYTEPQNNQPLTTNGTAIAFNGVISQGTKEEMEQEFGMVLDGDNDGYVLLRKYSNKDFVFRRDITFAFVGLRNKKLVAMRNDKRPLHRAIIDNAVIYCSTNDILSRSGVKESKEVKPFTILTC